MPGVFRHAHVFVQQTRSPRLVFLLGRRRRHAGARVRSSCISRWSFPTGPPPGYGSGKAPDNAAVSPRRPAVPRERDSRRPPFEEHAGLFAGPDVSGPGRTALPVGVHDRRSRRVDAGDGPRPVGHGSASASLDHLGHGVRRGPVRARLCAAVRAGPAHVPADGALGHPVEPDPARVRLGADPVPAHGRRGDRQAQPRVRVCRPCDLHDLRHAAPPRRHRVSRRCRSPQHDHRDARDDRRGAAVQSSEERDTECARPRLLPRQIRLSPRARRVCARPEQRPRSRSAQRAPRGPGSRDVRDRPHGPAARGRSLRKLRGHPR